MCRGKGRLSVSKVFLKECTLYKERLIGKDPRVHARERRQSYPLGIERKYCSPSNKQAPGFLSDLPAILNPE